jgi:hypothetical protein
MAVARANPSMAIPGAVLALEHLPPIAVDGFVPERDGISPGRPSGVDPANGNRIARFIADTHACLQSDFVIAGT